MPFWKKDKNKDEKGDNKTNGSGEKINYKARLEHKQYLVRVILHILCCFFAGLRLNNA